MPATTISSDYWTEYLQGDPTTPIYLEDKTLARFGRFPTEEEVNRILGTSGVKLDLSETFYQAVNMTGAPRLPDTAVMDSSDYGIFEGCDALVIPPALPTPEGNKSFARAFYSCDSLLMASVIPRETVSARYMYAYCRAMVSPPSIPENITDAFGVFNNCVNMAGEFIVRPTAIASTSVALRETTGQLTIYGDRAICETIAATANNGNASWSPWYDPIPAVTNRGQGSYTTAEDMTRMVRNGALAVPTYAPGRMRYQQGDIVRADEWRALVEAAQTIDPTVTDSTGYANLNKIEAAFESAL